MTGASTRNASTKLTIPRTIRRVNAREHEHEQGANISRGR